MKIEVEIDDDRIARLDAAAGGNAPVSRSGASPGDNDGH